MTNSKSTKRALLTSSISLLLCFAMLLGTTFAWFTDSATTARNVIQSGNLDVVLEYKTDWDDKWTPVGEDTKLFKEGALYEPGYTEVVFLRVSNAGSLALKYNLNVNVYGETTSINVANETFSLKDYLEIGYYVQDEMSSGFNYADVLMPTMFGTREAALSSVSTKKLSADTGIVPADAPVLAGTDTAQVAAIVLTMPETVGNEANHKTGVAAPTIDLGVTLVATQFTHENDSFGNQYDKNADYPTVINYDHKVNNLAELKSAFEAGGNILLEDDVTFDKITTIEPGKEVYLNLNGKTITVDQNTASNTLIWVKDGAKLTIDGNGTFDLKGVSTMAIFAPYGELVIENGTFIRDEVTVVTDKTTGLFMGCKTTASNVTINGGYFDGGYYDTNAADIEDILAGTKEFSETTDDIAKRGNSKDANLVRVALKDNVSCVLNHSGYGTFKVYGGTFVGMNPAWGDEGCMLPTTPNYLRPWSYYQGALLAGQTFNENGIVLPEGYTITQGTTGDGRPTYTVNYSK